MSDSLDELPPELAALYEADREIPTLAPDVQARMWSRLQAGVAVAGAGAVTAKVVSWKVAALASALSFVAGGAVVYGALELRSSDPPAAQRSPRHDLAPVDAGPPESDAGQDAGVESDAGQTTAATPSPAAPASVEPAEMPARASLRLERRLLETARAALARGRTSYALATLSRHRQVFEDGQLAEERDALEVEVLVEAERMGEARRAAARFAREHPGSLYQQRVNRLVARGREDPHEGDDGL